MLGVPGTGSQRHRLGGLREGLSSGKAPVLAPPSSQCLLPTPPPHTQHLFLEVLSH